MDVTQILALVAPAVLAGAGAWVAVRIELAVLKARMVRLEQDANYVRERMDSMFRLKTLPAHLDGGRNPARR